MAMVRRSSRDGSAQTGRAWPIACAFCDLALQLDDGGLVAQVGGALAGEARHLLGRSFSTVWIQENWFKDQFLDPWAGAKEGSVPGFEDRPAKLRLYENPTGKRIVGIQFETRPGSAPISDRRYEALAKTGSAVIWRALPSGRVVEAAGWAALTGQADEQPESWLEFLHPDDQEQISLKWMAAVESGSLPPVEYRVRSASGTYNWVRAKAVPVRSPTGEIVEWLGTLTDIDERKRAERALQESEEQLRLAIQATGLGVWTVELPSRATWWSAELKAMAGLSPGAEIDDAVFYGLVAPEYRDIVEAKITAAMLNTDPRPWTVEYPVERASDGQQRRWREWGQLVVDQDGNPVRVVGAMADITEEWLTESARAADEQRWRLALEATKAVVWEREVGTGATTSSANALEVLGLNEHMVTDFHNYVHPEDRSRVLALLAPDAPRDIPIEFRYRHPDGRELWLESSSVLVQRAGLPHSVLGVTSDITDRKQSAARLTHAATVDVLTGLWNRAAFSEILKESAVNDRSALLLIDLDRFKETNDALGHAAGDRLLRETAEHLRSTLPGAACARLGGDEFAVLIQLGSPSDVREVCRNLLAAIAVPVTLHGHSIRPSASIGVALRPEHAQSSEELLRAADLALYEAKGRGGGQHAVFEPILFAAAEQRASIIAELGGAIERGEVVPYYQPKVMLASGQLAGMEALARWESPTRGLLGPSAFSAALDDPIVAAELDQAIARSVIDNVRAWSAAGLDTGRIAINVSLHSFAEGGIVAELPALIRSAGLDPCRFIVEVTETVFLNRSPQRIRAVLDHLRQSGINVSLDDFGTGFASLSHLKIFPVDEIKIDRSFVRDLETDPDDLAIASAVVSLGRSLNLQVVAEGIETPEQERTLIAMGCRIGQGYRYGRPTPFASVPLSLIRIARRAATWPV